MGAFPRDEIEMRGIAPDHAAQRHHRIDQAFQRERARRERQLEGTRHTLDPQTRVGTAVRMPGPASALHQRRNNVFVIARGDDREPIVARR
jgi:hypothetical protein